MKRLIIFATIAALLVPAAALAAFDTFRGFGTDDDGVKVNFDLRGKREIESFKAKKIRYKCNERDTFRANPPEFPSAIDVDSKGKFDDSYTLTDKEEGLKIKFKGKTEGKLFEVTKSGDRKKTSDKKARHGDRTNRRDNRRRDDRRTSKEHFNRAKGTMEFHARYQEDGDRCESKSIDWKAEID